VVDTRHKEKAINQISANGRVITTDYTANSYISMAPRNMAFQTRPAAKHPGTYGRLVIELLWRFPAAPHLDSGVPQVLFMKLVQAHLQGPSPSTYFSRCAPTRLAPCPLTSSLICSAERQRGLVDVWTYIYPGPQSRGGPCAGLVPPAW